MNMNNAKIIKDCFSNRNQVIFIFEKTVHIIDADEKKRNELLSADKYVEYGSNRYDGEQGAITIYKIKERVVDQNNNLLLISEMAYIRDTD